MTRTPGTRVTRRPGRPGRPGRAAALPPEQRRAAIIAAAAPLLRRHGHDVTTRQIAEAAGIAEGTVFRAFPTKQAVLDAVLADACDPSTTVESIRAIDRSAPLAARVRSCTAILGEHLSAMVELMIALRRNGPTPSHHGPDGAGGRAHAAARLRRQRDRQDQLDSAIADLLQPDADSLAYPPERAAHLLRLLTFAGTHRLINERAPLTADEVADVLLYGITRAAPDPHGVPPPEPDG